MSFDYENLKTKHESEGNQWSSYSDLFMVLSLVFLLLYVTANLRGGTFSLQQQAEYQRLAQEAEELRQQLKVYNTLKDDYLQTGASKSEQDVYAELMDKLTLLKEEAKDEKNDLRKQASENEKKEKALNKYQQVIRNIVNANLIAQTRIKKRDTIIEEKDDVITTKRKQITSLEKDIKSKSIQVKKGERQIKQIQKNLKSSIEDLEVAFERNRISKVKMNQKVAELKKKTQNKLENIKDQKSKIQTELSRSNIKLMDVNSQLETSQRSLASQEKEKNELMRELSGSAKRYEAEMDNLKTDFEDEKKRDRKKYLGELKRQKYSARVKTKKAEIYKNRMKEKEQALGKKIGALKGQMRRTKGKLKKAQELANARKILASRIKKSFEDAGVAANVDPATGDVVLSFGNDYFDTGQAKLKTAMRDKLEKFMPIYASSLFKDKKIAEKITSVEIIGYASPTYQGKYVDPKSLSSKDRIAVKYNLDLSYNRARSIFSHIFDTDKMQYSNQRRLLPLVKVTGRSFLAEGLKGRDIASGISQKEFCKKFNCKKAQKVIIKFDLDN